MADIDELRLIIANMAQKITELSEAVKTTRPSSNHMPKVATPQQFDGKPENCESFLYACDLYFSARSKEFEDEAAKVQFALSYCFQGKARQWAERMMEVQRHHADFTARMEVDPSLKDSDIPPIAFESWADFCHKLRGD